MALVGRERELDLLSREVSLAVEISAGRSVFIDAPPGTGKTALVAAFLEQLAAERPGLAIARGRCLQTFGSGDPYLPFVDALRDLSDEKTAGFVNRDTISSLLTELAPFWLSAIPVVGNILSATYSTAARLRGQAPQGAAPSREALFVQYLEVIKGLAQEAPLILFLDDLHWADQASVALLAHVSRGIAQLPVVILGTLRRLDAELEKHPLLDVIRELEREDLGKRIQLGDLDQGALGGLMAAEFGGEVSEPLRRWMLQTAGGNPLFVSELARLLKQSDAVVEQEGEWHLTEAAKSIEVPRSAEAVIETRIQRLDPEEIKLLQYASVEGNDFDSVVVARLLEADELEMLDTFERLERRHRLIETTGELELPDGDVATTFRFRHALVQTVLYRQVVGKRRILLHRKAAETIDSLFGGRPETVAPRLARHYHEGRVKESAHRFARIAADSARRVYGHWEAEEFFKIALENSPGDEESADLEERLGDVYDTVAYYPQGIEHYQRSLVKRADQAGPSLRLRRKILILEQKAGLTPAPVLLQRVRALLAETEGYPEERCHLLLQIGRLPDAVDVIPAHREAVQLAEQLGHPLLLAQCLERLAVVLVFAGQTEEALPPVDRAREIVETAGDLLSQARVLNIAAIAHARLGRYRDALGKFQEMLAMAERLGDPHLIGAACGNLGAVMLRLGAFAEAEEMLQRALEIHRRRDRATQLQSLLNLAERARLAGDLPLAIERYQHLTDLAREFEYWSSEAVAEAGLGLCHLEANHVQEARECAFRAISAIADREEWFEDRNLVETLLGRLEALDGRMDTAVERLARTATILEAADVYLWAMVKLDHTRLMREADPEGASAILLTVIETTSRMQSPLLERQIAVLRESLPLSETSERVP